MTEARQKAEERFCAKCRDKNKWTKAEDVNGDGVDWHWRKFGKQITALAKRCMKIKSRWNGFKYVPLPEAPKEGL